MTSVAIVVPTKDRPAPLARCLRAAAAQRDIDSLEILVVDDGSSNAEEIAAIVGAQPLARLVRLNGAGPAAARNAGARAATATVICFTDDDCLPQPDWASRLVRVIEAGADAAGGATVSGRPGDPFVEASELIVRELQTSTQRRFAGKGVFIPTNNLACRRAAVMAYPFDEHYVRAAGEDRAWCAQVAAEGLTLVLEPRAVVAHNPVLGLGGFWRQHMRYGRGAYRFARTKPSPAWQEPLGFYVGLFRAGLGISFSCMVLILLAQFATTVGLLLEAAQSLGRAEDSTGVR